MAKFRNLLVHQYGKVDNAVVLNIIKHDTVDLTRYTEEIKLFLSSTLKEE